MSTIDQDGQLPPDLPPFLEYAILYWPEHVSLCYHRASDLFEELCSLFESNQSLRKYWWNRYHMRGHFLREYTIPLLHMVSFLGITPWVEALLQKNSLIPNFVSKEDEEGMRPVDWAALGEQEKVVERLPAYTVFINNPDRNRSLVGKAIDWSNQRVLRMLSERGADLESKDKNGCTPLHLAAGRGEQGIVMFLVKAGVDTMTKDRACRTVLHAACSSNMERVVRRLLHMGLDVKAKDKFKNTMLHAVTHQSIQRECQPLFRLLISKGLDIQAKNCHGSTPLHMAAASGNSALVQLLIEHGADVNAQNRFRNMPLHSVLMYRGYGKAAKLLISNGADVNAPDDRGKIPLKDCIQKHELEFPILDPKARDTGCECVEWKLQIDCFGQVSHEYVSPFLHGTNSIRWYGWMQ